MIIARCCQFLIRWGVGFIASLWVKYKQFWSKCTEIFSFNYKYNLSLKQMHCRRTTILIRRYYFYLHIYI